VWSVGKLEKKESIFSQIRKNFVHKIYGLPLNAFYLNDQDLTFFWIKPMLLKLFRSEMQLMQKTMIFFYGNHNLNAQFKPKIMKYHQLGLNHLAPKQLAWTLPEPHISTSENLHAKPKPIFSESLRGKTTFFTRNANFANSWQKTYSGAIMIFLLSFGFCKQL
jgi:hypothetical protein